MSVQTAGKSHPGRVMGINQDRFLIKSFPLDRVLLVLADGLGGQAHGEVAAETAVETLAAFKPEEGDPGAQLVRLVEEADRSIELRSRERSDLEEMGTTLIAASLDQDSAHWVHVGDSRLYRLRRGVLCQISKDQTMAQFLLDEGQIEPHELPGHPLRNLMEQCLGGGEVEVAGGSFDLEPGDTVMLCSDGLYNEVGDKEIQEVLSSPKGLEEQVEALIQAALAAVGRDNISVVAGRT
jgi:PPM family protein phosphatase